MAIGVFLVVTFSWFKIPQTIFHIFSILGIAMLIYIATQLFKTKKIDYEKEQKYIGTIGIILLMVHYGPSGFLYVCQLLFIWEMK
jgi:threonine/homoserine/homoserine lactone efflux protein